MPKYISVDPGDASGWVTWDDKGNPTGMGTTHSDNDLLKVFAASKPEVIIAENWISAGHRSFGGNPMNTARLLGKIELWADQNGAKLILQPNTVKSIAYKWAGITKPKNHSISHEPDAYVHGVYYLQRNGIRRPQQGVSQ